MRDSLLVRASAVLVVLFAVQLPAVYFSNQSQRQAVASDADAARVERVVVDAGQLAFGMALQRVGMDSYLATANPVYLDDYISGVEDVYVASRSLDRDVKGTGFEGRLSSLERSMDGWMTWARARRVEVDASRQPVTDAGVVGQGEQLFDGFRLVVDGFAAAAGGRATALRADADQRQRQQVWFTLIGSLAGSALPVVMGVAFLAFALRPLARLAATARGLARERHQVVPYAGRRDEVGALARALASWQAAQTAQRAIVEHLPIALFILGPDARLLTMNPKGEQMSGYTLEECRRMTLADLVLLLADPADGGPNTELYARLLSGETEGASVEQRFRRKDGSEFWGSLTLTGVREPGGGVGYMVGMVQDITERKEKLVRAAEVQRELLPESAPEIEGYDLAGVCKPAEDVGGDFFDWHQEGPGTLTLTLGDVMGKGLSAAILMAAVRTALRAGSRLPSVADTVQSAADSISRNLENAGAFVTLFHGRVDLESGLLSYVDAGHGLILLLRRDGGVTRLKATALPLGALHGQVYAESSVVLRPGESLVVFSDGVLDMYPGIVDPRQAAAPLKGAASAREMAESMTAGASAGRPGDDVTVVVLRRSPRAGARPSDRTAAA